MPYSADREWFTLAVDVTPTALSEPEERESEQENVAAGSHGSPTQVDGPVNTGKLAVGKSTLSQTFYWTFVVIPKGIFEIGTSSDEKGREKDEVRHQVELTRSFAVLDREITLEELIAFSPLYSEFMLQFDAQPSDAGFGAHWYDSVAFCRWLSQQSGLSEDDQAYAHPDSLDDNVFLREPAPAASWAPRNWPMKLGKRGFRLPTEAEWEAASRCRTRTAYSFGSDPGLLGSYAWFTGNSGGRGHPPRKKRPNFRGLFDVHGNVMEWTHDWWDEVWQNEGVDGDNTKVATDPLGPLTGSLRTNRGGNWNADPAFLRSGSRHGGQPTTRIVGLGLRIALSLPSRESQEKEEQGDGGTEEQSEAATTVP
jgi:formylglycine-generating enzyme required for sulfatase activity